MENCFYYQEKGNGQPIILIHGLGLNNTIWNMIAELLSSRFRVILPDMRAHGKSFSSEMEFSMRDMGEDVVRMMDRMDIPSAIIAGHSMGGYIALSILKNFPERIIGIALIASHIYADSESKKKQRIIMAEQLTTEEPGDVFYDMPGKLTRDRAIADLCKDMIKQTDAAGIKGVLRAMAHRPSSKELWKLNTIPSMIVIGKEDSFIPVETIRKMTVLNGNTVVHEIENAGHMVMMEKPDITSNILSNWSEGI